jgi:hypothetical protein
MMVADLTKLRGELVDMLLDDRRRALEAKNPSAAVTASSRIVDLMLGKFAEDVTTATPVTQLTHVIVHQVICPVCKERSAISGTPPPDAEPEAAPPRCASGWDDGSAPAPEPVPAPAQPAPGTILVAKLPRTDCRRDRSNSIVRGLV